MKFKRLKIPSDKATSYLKNDKELSQYWERLNRDCYGEIIIDSDTLDHIGHVFVWHTKKNKGFIFNLEVKPQYRRQGYGWILLDDAVKKYDGIDLLVDKDNIPAIKLYEKYGFETIKTIDGQLWMKLNQIKQEGVIMFFDRLGNSVTGEPKIVEEPVVESYYDPNRPVRPGFEKPQPIQEGLFDIFKKDPPFESFEEMEEYTGSKVDPSFKKFNQSHNKGDIMNYPVSKIDDDCRKLIEEYYGNNTVSFNLFGEEDILKREGKYRDVIELNDYCTPFAEVVPDQDRNLDTLCLWIATDKTKSWKPGTVVLSEVINSDYPDDIYGIFAKSFKDFLKNATFGKDIKEYSEMDLDEMSDYISEQVITEANEEAKKARKNAQEFMRKEFGTAHPTSMTSKQRNRMKRWLKDNDYDPETRTIRTDIVDKKTGKPVRVNLGTNIPLEGESMPFSIPNTHAFRKQLGDEAREDLLRDGRGYINMPKSYMKRHPSISTGISKHEEGHIADFQYGEKMAGGKAGVRGIKKLKKNGVTVHQHLNPGEVRADVYSVQHNKYEDKLRFLRALISKDAQRQKQRNRSIKKLYNMLIQDSVIDLSDIKMAKKYVSEMVESYKEALEMQNKILNSPNEYNVDPSQINLLKTSIKQLEDLVTMYTKLLEKLNTMTNHDDAEKEVKTAVRKQVCDLIGRSLKLSDEEVEFRIKMAKKFIKEFAVEYNMNAFYVIQEMYLQDMEDYVFQEDYEEDEFVSREIILEEKISAAERNELDDDDFGLVYTDEDGKKVRKYPLTDENHIRQAVRFFSHCPDEHKPHLARKILKKANEHDIDTSNWETIHEWAKK